MNNCESSFAGCRSFHARVINSYLLHRYLMNMKCNEESNIPTVLHDKALEGDMHAMRLLLERLVPKVQVVDMNLQSDYEPITEIRHIIISPTEA